VLFRSKIYIRANVSLALSLIALMYILGDVCFVEIETDDP